MTKQTEEEYQLSIEETHERNKRIKEFVEEMPKLTDNLRECMLYAIDLVDELEVSVEGVEYRGGDTFVINFPLFEPLFKVYYIPMQFSLTFWGNEGESISCGPSTYDANKEEVKAYIDWLTDFMPRRSETLRDIIENGNRDNLKLPIDIEKIKKQTGLTEEELAKV
jgi:hypothetical protein